MKNHVRFSQQKTAHSIGRDHRTKVLDLEYEKDGCNKAYGGRKLPSLVDGILLFSFVRSNQKD